MKKYRLIEHSPNYNKVVGTWDDDAQAANAMFTYSLANASAMYRIEEVEECITDRVKTYEDACEVLGKFIIPVNSLYVKFDKEFLDTNLAVRLDKENSLHILTLYKLETISAALNEGWKPDWKDGNQEKWWVRYFTHSEQFGVYSSSCMVILPNSLYFKSKELAEYASKQFGDLYKQLFIEKF